MVITTETVANAPLPLAGPQNLRELGGYPTVHGTETAKGRLLRSDGLHALTRGDKEALFRRGVRCVIDLRSEDEQRARPDRFEDYPCIRTLHFPMFVALPKDDGGCRDPDTLAELYIALLEGAKGSFCSAMRAISRAGYGCVLFHCAAGKDRTGMVSMLLLLLAGVPGEVVIADYCASCHNMAVLFARQKLEMHAGGLPVNEALFRSSRADIEAAMGHLCKRYGGAEGYLRHIGCTRRELDSLRGILLGATPEEFAV